MNLKEYKYSIIYDVLKNSSLYTIIDNFELREKSYPYLYIEVGGSDFDNTFAEGGAVFSSGEFEVNIIYGCNVKTSKTFGAKLRTENGNIYDYVVNAIQKTNYPLQYTFALSAVNELRYSIFGVKSIVENTAVIETQEDTHLQIIFQFEQTFL